MAPPIAAVATATDDTNGTVQLSAPCNIHDDRLRELETEQASQRAQLAAGADMFRAIQDSIRTLSEGVRDSMTRVEFSMAEVASDVRNINEKVSQVQVKQASHEEQLKAAAQDRLDEKEAAKDVVESRRERNRTIRDWAFRISLAVIGSGGAVIAASHGKGLLEAILKAIAGG